MQDRNEKINHFLSDAIPIVVRTLTGILQSSGWQVEQKGCGLELVFILRQDEKEVGFYMHNLFMELATLDRTAQPMVFDEQLGDFNYFIANRPQVELPKYLPTKDVNKLLYSCDQTRPLGIRDYALLILMARLGLRSKEIARLTLDDINWKSSVITIYGKGGYKDELPIPQDVGRAIAMYLKKARPKCNTRALFVSVKAPIKKLEYLSNVVKRACKKAGLSPPHQGVHLLRHSLATRMLQEGAMMVEIAEILRHRSIEATRIYAKVDLKSLRETTRPWPEIIP